MNQSEHELSKFIFSNLYKWLNDLFYGILLFYHLPTALQLFKHVITIVISKLFHTIEFEYAVIKSQQQIKSKLILS